MKYIKRKMFKLKFIEDSYWQFHAQVAINNEIRIFIYTEFKLFLFNGKPIILKFCV